MTMGLEVYYPQDIWNALLAAKQANGAALQVSRDEDNEFAEGYKTGYRTALTTMALAFGLIKPNRWKEDLERWSLPDVAHDFNWRGQIRERV